MPIFLHALALRHYRGIGPNIQKLHSFREFNFFIGANNAGKSTILAYLWRHLNHDRRPQQLLPIEQYRGQVTGNTIAAVGIPISIFLDNIYTAIGETRKNRLDPDTVRRICELVAEDNIIWITHPVSDLRHLSYLAARPSVSAFRAVVTSYTRKLVTA
jgi:recombinational DNA repair ATPase RecF